MRHHTVRPDHASVAAAPRFSRRGRGHVLCGIHAVQEALRLGTRRIESIWLAEGKEGKRLQQVKALAAVRGTPIEIVAHPRLIEAAGTTMHQGIVAFVASPPLLTFDEL